MPHPQAAAPILSRTARPAGPARFISASRLNLSIRPRIKSFKRGCVTPKRRAASVWLIFQLSILLRIAIISSERARILAASAAVSSRASQTLANVRRAMFNPFAIQQTVLPCVARKFTRPRQGVIDELDKFQHNRVYIEIDMTFNQHYAIRFTMPRLTPPPWRQ